MEFHYIVFRTYEAEISKRTDEPEKIKGVFIMKKRVIAALLAGVMTMSLLAACGNSGTPASNESASAQSETETKADADESGESEEPGEESGETVTIKWCIPGDRQPDHDAVLEDVNKKIKEKLNLELDLDIIPQGEFNDRMKLASTAGETFDLVFTANWLNSFDENMSRDAFLPITDLISEYGQDMAASMPDWLLDVAKVDGELYAVPNQQIIARQMGVVIRKDMAEKYGFNMDSMKSIHDIEPFLDEIVKNESGIFPIDKRVEALYEETYETVGSYASMNKETGEILPYSEAITDQMRLDNEWYQKGYIREDIATVTDNSADVKANRYAVSLSSYKPGWSAEYTNRQGMEYIDVPIEGAYVGAVSGIETMTAVNVNSEHPEEAVKLLNLVYTDKEIFNELLFGLEGTHYNVVSENHVEVAPDSAYNFGSNAWRIGNQFNAWYMPGQEDGLWEATVSSLRGFTFNQSNVQAEMAQLAAVAAEYKNGQFTANDIEAFIAEYQEKMEQAGIQTVVDEVNRQIEEWKAAK